MKVARKQLHQIIETDVIRLRYDNNKADVFLVDYILKLSDPDVAKAFSEVVKQIGDLQTIKLVLPIYGRKQREKDLALDIESLEKLYRSDMEAGIEGRIVRNVRTSAQMASDKGGFNLGNELAEFGFSERTATSTIKLRADDESLSNYVMSTKEKRTAVSWLFSLGKLVDERKIQGLFKTDMDGANFKPVQMVATFEKKDKELGYSEFLKVKTLVDRSVHQDVSTRIPWEKWDQFSKDKVPNFGLRLEIVLTPEAILLAPSLNAKEIKERYLKMLAEKKLNADDFYHTVLPSAGARGGSLTSKMQLASELREIGKKLAKAFQKEGITETNRLQSFMSLHRNKLFSQTGMTFFMGLNPEMIDKWFHVELVMSGGNKKLEFKSNEIESSELYRKLVYVDAALQDDGVDIRRDAEALNVHKPKKPVVVKREEAPVEAEKDPEEVSKED